MNHPVEERATCTARFNVSRSSPNSSCCCSAVSSKNQLNKVTPAILHISRSNKVARAILVGNSELEKRDLMTASYCSFIVIGRVIL